MRRLKYLITEARRFTENSETPSSTAGIQDEEFIQYMNDGQDRLFGKLEVANNSPFTKEEFIAVVGSQEAYDLHPRTWLKNNIVSLEYSYNGNAQNYYPLEPRSVHERDTSLVGIRPRFYILRNGQILLNPIPKSSQSTGLRVNYVQAPDRLDKRRAVLDSVTVVAGEITVLSVDITDFTDYFPGNSAFSSSDILVDDYFSVVNAAGAVQARNIPITAINASTGDATITSYTPEETTETGATGNYLVAGASSTTHSSLPNNCERYLWMYSAWKIFRRDNNMEEGGRIEQELLLIEADLVESWQDLRDDNDYIPVTDDRFLYP